MQKLADDTQLHLQDAVLIIAILATLGLTLAMQMSARPELVVVSVADAISDRLSWLIDIVKDALA